MERAERESLQMSIQTVRDNIEILESQDPEDAGYYLQLEHEKRVLKALEKQMPKKPLNPCGRWCGKAKGGNCPVCGSHTTDNVSSFCRKCGQALDWRGDTE